MIDYKKLINKAKNVQKNAYSPYSKFKVGACVLTKNNNYYCGVNVENASYGATICAERNAINNAISNGEKEFIAIAITSSSKDYTFPCGICRQYLTEFNKDIKIIVAKNENEYKIYTLEDLVPNYFSIKDIK